MSASSPIPVELDWREQIARIDRAQAETRKFVAERDKLLAEAGKLNRDRGLAPWLVAGAVAGGVATVASLALRLIGAGP